MEKTDLIISSFKLHKEGLEAIGSPTYEQWLACGKFIRNASGAIQFWIGDWLNFGEKKYGDTYTKAVEQLEFDIKTLRNYKFVSAAVEKSRRRDNLSFDHHSSVVSLPPDEQEKLLNQAESEHLNNKEFREVVKEYKTPPDQVQKDRDFSTVDEVVDIGVLFVDKLNKLNPESLDVDAKDYLLSQLKQTIGIVTNFVIKYE